MITVWMVAATKSLSYKVKPLPILDITHIQAGFPSGQSGLLPSGAKASTVTTASSRKLTDL